MQKHLPDIISLIGLALLGYGVFLFSPRLAFIVVGVLLLLAGIRLGASEAPIGNNP